MGIFKHGFKTMGSLIVAAVISFFLCISMNIICSAVFTSEIGYEAFVYETSSSTEPMTKYKYLYTDNDGDGEDDGVDALKAEYEDAGHIVETVKVRSSLNGVGKVIFFAVTQICSLIMIIAFASSSVYKQGFKDRNLVQIGQRKYDALKGFKIGLVGNIPFFALFIAAIVMALGAAPKFGTVAYAFLNANYYPTIMAIAGGKTILSQWGVLQFVLTGLVLMVAPIISGIAYVLGFKEINLAEKIVYKKEVK